MRIVAHRLGRLVDERQRQPDVMLILQRQGSCQDDTKLNFYYWKLRPRTTTKTCNGLPALTHR